MHGLGMVVENGEAENSFWEYGKKLKTLELDEVNEINRKEKDWKELFENKKYADDKHYYQPGIENKVFSEAK